MKNKKTNYKRTVRKFKKAIARLKLPKKTQGQKMAETKAISKKLNEKFPVGQIVYLKYHPKFVGVVTKKPEVKRWTSKGFPDYINQTIEVMWMCSFWHRQSGDTEILAAGDLMPKKDNKSVESGKEAVV